jgi:hypothetical protein
MLRGWSRFGVGVARDAKGHAESVTNLVTLFRVGAGFSRLRGRRERVAVAGLCESAEERRGGRC